MSPDDVQGFIAVMLLIGIYLLPTLIAYKREHHNRHAIAALNILLGWVLLGWVGALVWSLTAVDRPSRPAT